MFGTGQIKTKNKSNETTVILEILEPLDIKGSIITIDAMDTQTAIAKKIKKKEVDYILAVKDNQKTLLEEVEAVCKNNRPAIDSSEAKKGHGRIETRCCEVFEKGLIVDF